MSGIADGAAPGRTPSGDALPVDLLAGWARDESIRRRKNMKAGTHDSSWVDKTLRELNCEGPRLKIALSCGRKACQLISSSIRVS
ncbi:hypothetical protein [Bradyrhizobium sp. Gha]|uniref:hypothetical protein n=1 Tax=Bradyrhizobium sp. Gha TaxID=1855318 RepID=UPI000B844DF5|nr:hypothetical protein [Bradyrhizobium sp. Gha]